MRGLRLFLVSSVLVAGSVSAQLIPIERPVGAPAELGDAVQSVRADFPQRTGGVRQRVVTVYTSDSAFLITIAGNTAGSGGTYFRSDVVIANYRGVTQNIGIGWMALGADNTHVPLVYFTIPANTIASLDDFVNTTLHKTGLGGILVFGVDSGGNNDSGADLDGFSRIWTPQPGSSGSVSQNFDAVSLTDSIGSLTAYIIGLKQSASFRSNVGVVNLDTVSHTWTVRSVQTGAVTTLTVPPYSVVQTGVAAGSATGSNANFGVTVNSDGFGFWWSAYASSSDNVTGDGWVARAKQ